MRTAPRVPSGRNPDTSTSKSKLCDATGNGGAAETVVGLLFANLTLKVNNDERCMIATRYARVREPLLENMLVKPAFALWYNFQKD